MTTTALPTVLLLYISLILQPVFAAQQCQLKAQYVVDDPSTPEGDPGINSTTSAIPTSASSSSTATSSASSTPSPSPTLSAFSYQTDKIRGVNLGGWLVLEPWITPSLFENTNNDAIIDEYTFGQMQDEDVARANLEKHWDTWITEDDFIAINAAGLSHVRIPLGYWSVPMTSSDTSGSTDVSPYLDGAWPFLLRGLNWARKHDVRVIVDIHGAPGSQNGYDNSGQRTGNPQWGYNAANVARTVDTVAFVAREIGGMIDVLELLNEPAGFLSDAYTQAVRQYWLDGYAAVREEVGDDLRIMIGDAFRGVSSWTGFMTSPQYTGVLMDFHEYQIFSNAELERSLEDHVQFACTYKSSLKNFADNNIWTVVGEWSTAATDCTKWLNGRGIGARWDGSRQADDTKYFGSCDGWTGNYASFSDSYKQFLRRYWEVQTEIAENVNGWVYWTWKAENSDDWSYQRGLAGGWIPQDPTNRLYPNICP